MYYFGFIISMFYCINSVSFYSDSIGFLFSRVVKLKCSSHNIKG